VDRPTDSTPSSSRKGSSIPRGSAAAVLALALALAGCSSLAPAAPSSALATSGPTESATQSSSPTAAPYPLTLTDDEDTELTLEADPARIVSLTPAVTETLFALGEGESVVGGTDFDDFPPPQAAALPDVATFEGVLIERLVDLDPDLVIAGGNSFTPPDDVARLRDLGFPVLVVYAQSVDEVLADIELLGRAAGASDEAERIVADMEARFAEVSEAVGTVADRPRVFYELGDQPEIYGPADDSFIADMIKLAGGQPITTGDPDVFSIPLERLVAADPEVILLGDAAYGVTPAIVGQRPGGWAAMTAVEAGAVRPVDDIIITRPGPRLGEGLAALAEAIHPELDLAAPPAPSLPPASLPAASPSPS
jgi:iron complex transport system substrate-binding protein